MTHIPAEFRKQPGRIGDTVIRQFKGYRVGCASFGISGACRRDIEPEWFGHIPRFVCADCGPISEPEEICTTRESWGYYGGQPAEYENRCPSCGGWECGENEDPELRLKVTSHSTYTISRPRRAA